MLLFASNDTTIMLNGVTVVDAAKRDYQMRSSQNSVRINQAYLAENIAGSLMQSLEGIPGIKAMSIGSGQSKPTIRGLGFNRMVVTEDGIKHEGQQWGDDHGLEMDQFAIDHAEVIKGPAALLHGSDAIGGVLNLYTNHVPVMPFEGTVQLFGRTNNGQMGLSAKVGGRYEHFFYRANLTLIDYADFKVPTDSIQYYSYFIRLGSAFFSSNLEDRSAMARYKLSMSCRTSSDKSLTAPKSSSRWSASKSTFALSSLSSAETEDAMSKYSLTFTNARRMEMLAAIATSLCRTDASMAIPSSVNARGGVRRPPQLEVTNCDFKFVNSLLSS